MLYLNKLHDYVKGLFIRSLDYILNEPFVEAGFLFQLKGGG